MPRWRTSHDIEAFAALGLDNQITEMDMSVYTDGTSRYQVVPEEILVEQAYRYRDIFREYRRLSESISSVTFWGLADDNTWLSTFPIPRLDLPLLYHHAVDDAVDLSADCLLRDRCVCHCHHL